MKSKRNPVAKYAGKVNRAAVHRDKSKYNRDKIKYNMKGLKGNQESFLLPSVISLGQSILKYRGT